MEISAAALRERVQDVAHELTAGQAGYVVVRGLLPQEEVATARAAVQSGWPMLRARLFSLQEPVRIYHLPSRSPAFGRMLDDAALGLVLAAVCGEGVKCGSFHTHTIPGAAAAGEDGEVSPAVGGSFVDASCLAQRLHIDYPYGRGHAPFLEDRNPPEGAPRTCQVLWMLDDFTEANGATMVVPGSQSYWRAPDPSASGADVAHAIAQHARVTGRAGDAMIYTGQLWHAVPRNHTPHSRTAVLGQFLPYYMHSMESHARSTPRAVIDALPNRAAALYRERVRTCVARCGRPWYDTARLVGDVLRSLLPAHRLVGLVLGLGLVGGGAAKLLGLRRGHGGATAAPTLTPAALLAAAAAGAGFGFATGAVATLSHLDL